MARVTFLPPPNSTRIGTTEISRMQDIFGESLNGIMQALIKQVGLVNLYGVYGSVNADWGVTSVGAAVTIAAGKAVIKDSDDVFRGIDFAGTSFNVSGYSDGTYNVLLRYATSTVENGTVAVTNGATGVIGTDTEFKSILAPGRKIIIGANSYVVNSVTDDLHLVLASGFPDTSNPSAQFSVGGKFLVDPSVGSQYLYQYDSYAIVITTSAPQTNDILFAEVVVGSGAVTSITDFRAANALEVNDTGGNYLPNVGMGAATFKAATGVKIEFINSTVLEAQVTGSVSVPFLDFIAMDDGSNNANIGVAISAREHGSVPGAVLAQVKATADGTVTVAGLNVNIGGTNAAIVLNGQVTVTYPSGGMGQHMLIGLGTIGAIYSNGTDAITVNISAGQIALQAGNMVLELDSVASTAIISDITGDFVTMQRGIMTVLGTLNINPTAAYNNGVPATYYNKIALGSYVSIYTDNSNTTGGVVFLSASGAAAEITMTVAGTSSVTVEAGYVKIISAFVQLADNVSIGITGTPTFGGGSKVLELAVTASPPTSSDAAGGLLWVASDGTLQYRTTGGVVSRIGGATTSDLVEGTNLYFTNTRVLAALPQALGTTNFPTFSGITSTQAIRITGIGAVLALEKGGSYAVPLNCGVIWVKSDGTLQYTSPDAYTTQLAPDHS